MRTAKRQGRIVKRTTVSKKPDRKGNRHSNFTDTPFSLKLQKMIYPKLTMSKSKIVRRKRRVAIREVGGIKFGIEKAIGRKKKKKLR